MDDDSRMNNFGRVLRISCRHYWSIAGILLTSIVIAILWGANISALYPLVEIVFDGKSLHDKYDEVLAENRDKTLELENQIANLTELAKSAEPAKRDAIERDLSDAQDRRDLIAKSDLWMAKVGPWIRAYAPRGAYATLVYIILFLCVCTAIKLSSLLANMLLVQFISERTAVELRAIFFRKALHLDLDSFGENGSADLTARLTNDIALVASGITVLLGRLIREPLKMIVCIGGAAYQCPRLLLLVLVVVPVVALVMQHLSRAIRRASRRAMEEMSQLYGMLTDSFSGIRVIKAFNAQAFERARFSRGTNAYFLKSMKVAFYNTLARSSSEMLGMVTVSLGVLAGGYLVLTGEMHLLGMRICDQPLGRGQVLLFFGFLIGASDPARKLSDVWAGLQRGIAATDRVYEIIDQPIRVREPENPRSPARPHKRIHFADVSYQYPSGPIVLRGTDLKIKHGETVAVVGPNGSGKSTLVSLLCRFDDPQGGSVLLDDTPLNQMRTRDLRKRIALVTQRTILFDDTIENNIRYGSPGADRHEVVKAAKLAFADDFILRKTPDGYDTVLGAGGMRLSGGQMQRIALARAFLRNPDILILDEATSQIDSESEKLIHAALSKFLVDRTGIMITHRPSSLAMADRIIVIEAGKVADSGQHEELFRRNRFYQSLCGVELRRSA